MCSVIALSIILSESKVFANLFSLIKDFLICLIYLTSYKFEYYLEVIGYLLNLFVQSSFKSWSWFINNFVVAVPVWSAQHYWDIMSYLPEYLSESPQLDPVFFRDISSDLLDLLAISSFFNLETESFSVRAPVINYSILNLKKLYCYKKSQYTDIITGYYNWLTYNIITIK